MFSKFGFSLFFLIFPGCAINSNLPVTDDVQKPKNVPGFIKNLEAHKTAPADTKEFVISEIADGGDDEVRATVVRFITRKPKFLSSLQERIGEKELSFNFYRRKNRLFLYSGKPA